MTPTNLTFDIYEYTEAIVKAISFMTRTSCDRLDTTDDLEKAAGARALNPYLNPLQNSAENIRLLLEFAQAEDIHLGNYTFTYTDGEENLQITCLAHEFCWDYKVISCEITS